MDERTPYIYMRIGRDWERGPRDWSFVVYWKPNPDHVPGMLRWLHGVELRLHLPSFNLHRF